MKRLLLATVWLTACAGAASGSAGGTGGSSGPPCTKLACLPPVTTHLNCAVEIDPPSSSTAAITQLPSVDLYGVNTRITLKTSADTLVSVTFTAPTNASPPATANAVVTVPSLIPGLPALTFQGPATPTSATVLTASLSVPSNLVDMSSAAKLALIPLPPADQQSPPYTSSVPLNSTLQMDIANNNVLLSGSLQSAIGAAPPTTFVARAFQNGASASNAPLVTPPTGAFQLLIPGDVVAAGFPLTVQLTPQSPTDPWFVSTPILAPFPMMLMSTIMLPAYTTPNPFTVVVQGPGGASDPVAGATVKASTVLGSTTLGTTQFSVSGLTDPSGNVSLSLLPGTAQNPRSYALTVIPPPGSPYATSCNSAGQASANGLLKTVTLMPRPVLTGAVFDAGSNGLGGVTITATPISGSSNGCPPASGGTSTASDGTFQLALDPGTYQLDVDPPAGSASPRATQSPFTVSTSMPLNLRMPPGMLVTGQVQAPAPAPDYNTALGLATVRLYQPQCTGSDCSSGTVPPPVLLGQAVTDANGNFQIVISQLLTAQPI